MGSPVGSVDVELELIGWTQARLGAAVVVRDELDNSILEELPTVQIQVVGGSDDGFRLDFPLVDVDAYASTRAAAIAVASSIHGLYLTQLRGSTTERAVVGMVRALTRPTPRPYDNTGLRRVGATYQIALHPVS